MCAFFVLCENIFLREKQIGILRFPGLVQHENFKRRRRATKTNSCAKVEVNDAPERHIARA